MNQSALASIGLSEQETAVYVATLELGEATVQEIARKSGVKRTSIYNFIDKLKDRQILFETKKKKRHVFSAAHPKHLLEMERLRLHELESTMPQLLAIHNLSTRKPRVTFYEGVEGIKEIYGDMLEVRSPIVAWSDQKHLWQVLGKDYGEYFPPERAKRGITFKGIANDTPENRSLSKNDEKLLRETKFMSAKHDLKTEINVYADKVLMASLRSSPAFAVLIQDQGIADTLRATWAELWNKLP